MYSILYVDDEPGLLEIAKIFLEQDKDFSVDTDTSAAHAIDPIGAKSYDAIISDYQMPGMDGIEFLKAVRQKYGDIPFILFTGRGREEVVIEAINNGADFYLQKGGDPRAQFAELAHKVRQAVARKRAEYSLVESEKRLTDIINFLPDATFAIDRAGTVIAWNRAIEEMTGVPAADMVGKGNFEYAIPFYGTRRKILIDLIFEPDDVIAKDYAHIHREKDVLIADTNLPRPRGKEVLLTGKASPLYDRQGKVVGAIEAIRDITQHEQDARRIAQKTSALSAINRIIQASNLRQTFDDYVQNVLSLTIDLLRYDAGGIYLLDDDARHARIICSENLGPEFIAAVDNIDVHAAPYNTLFLEGEPVIIENLETILPQAAAVSGFRAIASIPIVSQDRVIGAVNVASRASSLVDREDREILGAIGRELGSAIMQIRTATALQESEAYLRYMLGFYEKAEQSEDELRKYAVEGAGAVTGSPMGYLAFLNEDETVLTMYAWSKSAMAECSLREKPIVYPVDKTGLWGEAVRQRRPVITNDYVAPNPWKKGYPEGHPRIIRHMNVPVFDGDRIVLVAGVANRPSDYTDREVRELSLLMQGLWHVLKRQHVEKELRAAHEELMASDEELRGQYEELAFSGKKLRESESRFRELADATLEAIVIHMAGKIVDLNESACSLFGYSHDEMIGRDLLTLAAPESVEDIRRKIEEGYDTPYEAQGLRRDGSTFWAELRSRDFSQGDENLRITTLWDITARKTAEDAVRHSQEQLRAFMDSATDAFTIWDADLNLLDLNRTALSYLPEGVRKEDVIGKNFSAFMSGTGEWGLYDRYLEVLRTGIPFTGTEKLPDPRYGNHWLDVRCFRVGTGLGIVTTDVTRQKVAEEELRAAYEQITASEEELRGQLEELIATQEKLRESERQLAEIADTVPGVVYQFYARPDGSMGFYYISRRVEEIFGVGSEPDQFFDRVTANIDPRDRDKFLDSIRSAVAQGLPWHFEGRFIRPDGERIWFQGSSRPVRKGSELVYNGVLLDITARKNAEDARRASEERYRSVIEHSPYGIHFYVLKPGRQLVFTGANPGAERILKITHDQLIGKTIEEAFPGLAGTEIPERYREVAESGTTWHTEQVFYDHGEISGAYTVSAFPIAPGSIAAMFVDITERKRMEDALRERLVALTRPLEDSDIAFEDLFNIDEIQQLQDEFAQATGVAVLLTHPDGSPITRPSNFCRLCGEIVRRTEAGEGTVREIRCRTGKSPSRRTVHPYLSLCRIMGAGVPIVMGGRHIANWLIGQVRNESQTEDQMRGYAREIGVDEEDFVAAFLEVPVMSSDRFAAVAQSLQTLANQLSKSAYQNVQQARFITEREKAEKALREKTEELDRYFTASLDLFCIADTNGYFRRLNPEWERALGYSLADLEDHRFLDFVHPDDLPATLAAVATLKDQTEILNFTNRYRHKDGSYRWIEWRSFPHGDRIFAAARDITGRKRIEEELKASEERLRLFIRHAPAALAMLDTEMRYLAVSRRWMADYHLGDRDLTGHSHYEIFPELTEEIKDVIRRGLLGETTSANEDRFERQDGSIQWLAWEVRPWYTAGNDIGGVIIFSEDITRRKQAEEALRESEEKYRTLVERAGEAIAIFQDGRYVYANPRMTELLRKSVSDIIGMDFLETVWPDDREMLKSRYQDRHAGKPVPETYDFRLIGPEGRPRWVHVSIAKILWQGRPATLNLITDITERKLAEAALLESRAELSSILHGSPVLQFVINRDHRIVSWNKAIEEYTGLSADEVVGTDQQWRPFYDKKRPVLADLLVDNNTDGLFKWYSGKLKPSRYVEGAFEATDFFPLVGATGSWLSFTAAPIRNAEGGIIGAVETLEDVTERVHAEAALRESEGKYRRILENMQDAYIRTDENGIITMVNPSAVRMFGYSSPEDMTGMPASSLYLRPGDRDELLRILRESGGVTDIAGEMVREDGTTFSVSLNVQFIRDETGQVRGTEAIVRDVSERRAMERALQEANRKLALLGSITRHDVANKVAIITGFAQAARMHPLTPEIAVYLSKIEAAGADISRQIAFTKTYQELGVNAPAWVSIPDLVERQRAEGVAITCTCRAEVYADPMLEKVFLNLIDNAVRHGEKVTEIAVRCTTGPEGLVITVEDNGVGVADDLKEMIFERGFGKHTGFGLFLAREILAITGITIRETGTPGTGARFEMVVPEGGYRKIENA